MKIFIIFQILVIIQFDLISQIDEEIITLESSNPYTFNDIIDHLDDQEKQIVYGKLKFPEKSVKNKKYPLIIGVAGSLGWSDHHYEYLEMYRTMGIATFELNSFKSREIESTVGTQNTVTISAMILDAYTALKKLSNHPNIIKDKISITGWSLGGGVALFSAWLPLKNAIIKELKFNSHLAFYPPCFIEPEKINFSNSPIHILIGELDNWTPAEPCNDLFLKSRSNTNLGLTIFKNSHHSFDRNGPVIRDENAYNFTNCRFKLMENGDILMNYLNIPMSNSFLQKIGFAFCVSRGVDYGGNMLARKESFEFARKFMEKNLLL